jgi:2',3'-cyclic-nucleotide 2'-phosphodiesterase (5'-nucleotidase family)
MLASAILEVMNARRKEYLKKEEEEENRLLAEKLNTFHENTIKAWNERLENYTGSTDPYNEFVQVERGNLIADVVVDYMKKYGFRIVMYSFENEYFYRFLKVYISR